MDIVGKVQIGKVTIEKNLTGQTNISLSSIQSVTLDPEDVGIISNYLSNLVMEKLETFNNPQEEE